MVSWLGGGEGRAGQAEDEGTDAAAEAIFDTISAELQATIAAAVGVGRAADRVARIVAALARKNSCKVITDAGACMLIPLTHLAFLNSLLIPVFFCKFTT